MIELLVKKVKLNVIIKKLENLISKANDKNIIKTDVNQKFNVVRFQHVLYYLMQNLIFYICFRR